MTRSGWRTVALTEATVSKLQELKGRIDKSRARPIPLGAFIEDLLWEVIESNEALKESGAPLELVGEPEGDHLFIKDNKSGRVFEVAVNREKDPYE